MRRDDAKAKDKGLDSGPGEIDVRRQLSDLAARVEMRSPLHSRQATMQRLLAKALALSDREFETAVGALEGLIDRYSTQKATGGQVETTSKPADVLRDVERTLQEGLNRIPGR